MDEVVTEEAFPVNDEVLQLRELYPGLSVEVYEQLYARYGGSAENAANRILDDMMTGGFEDILKYIDSFTVNKENETKTEPITESPPWQTARNPRRPGTDVANKISTPIENPTSDNKSDVRIKQCPKNMTVEQASANLALCTDPEAKRLLKEVSSEIYPKLLLIMRGLPGSGKSTLATTLQSVTVRGVICSADYFFIGPNGAYNWNPNLLSAAHKQCQENCRRWMEKCVSPVIIDNTNIQAKDFEIYITMAIRHNYTIKLVEPFTPWKFNVAKLCEKGSHGLKKDKVKQLLSRYENVLEKQTIFNTLRKMGPIGNNYNPEKKETVETSIELSFDMRPRFEIQGANAANYDLCYTNDNVPKSSNLVCNSPRPLPLLYDQFVEEQRKLVANASPSDENGFRNKRSRKKPSGGMKICAQEKCPTPPEDFPPLPMTSDLFGDSADKVLNAFPECGKEELLDYFKVCQENADDTISMLLDSGYTMTGDPDVRRSSKPKIFEQTETLEKSQEDPEPSTSRFSLSRSESLKGSNSNRFKNQPLNPVSGTNWNPFESSGKESRSGTNSPDATPDDYSLVPVDGEDWVDFDLSSSIIESISDMYGGDIHGKLPSQLSEEERKIRIPPEMAFELFRYLFLNVSRIQHEKSEADGLASEDIVQEQYDNYAEATNMHNGICEEEEEEEEDELKEILLQIQKMENDAAAYGEPQSFSEIMSTDTLKASVEAMKMEKLKIVKRSMAQNIKFAQLKQAFPSLKPNLVDDFFLLSGFSYEKALKTLKEVYPSKFVDNSSKRIEEPTVCRSQFPHGEELTYDPDVVARMSATDKREMTEASERWKLQSRDYAESYEEYKNNAKKHRGHPETFSYFMLKATEVKDLLKQAQKEDAFYTVISLNAGNNNPNKIDLHGLPLQSAIEIVSKYLSNRAAWVRNNIGPGIPVHLNIITGIGKHSYNNIPKINPAVRNYLRSNHYSYSDQGGSFLVHLINTKNSKKH